MGAKGGTQVDRRTVIGGLAAGATMMAARPAWAAVANNERLFADTPMAGNALARHFRRVDAALPDVPVLTAAGLGNLSRVRGKTRLIALWAEWCAPCLAEIRDLARLRPQVASERFDIGLVLTASAAKLDRAGALAKLRPLGAEALPLLVEANGGKRAAEQLSLPPAGITGGATFSLPCVVLVDARGRVRGRASGAPMVRSGPAPVLTAEQKKQLREGKPVVLGSLSEADKAAMAANGTTGWGTPAGREFLRALSDGLLDRV